MLSAMNQVFKLIFLGPTSAEKYAPGKGKNKRKPVAELVHLARVTPRAIAYAAVQVRGFVLKAYDAHLIAGSSRDQLDGAMGYHRRRL